MTAEMYYQEEKNDITLMSKSSFDNTIKILESILAANDSEIVVRVSPLVKFIMDRSTAILLLLESDKIWDAEIIFRSVLEVLSKLLYIISQPNIEICESKLNEYWYELEEVEMIRRSDKCKEIIKSDRIMNLEIYRNTILSNEQEELLKSKPSWGKRRDLKQDWSFSGIMVSLLKNKDLYQLISIEMLQEYYNLSSHAVHGDSFGMSQIILRGERISKLKEAGELIHYIKLIKMANDIPSWVCHELANYINQEEIRKMILLRHNAYAIYIQSMYQPIMQDHIKMTHELIATRNSQ